VGVRVYGDLSWFVPFLPLCYLLRGRRGGKGCTDDKDGVGKGDYFGILMDHRVTSFPFNVTDAPMYYGSTMAFLGSALW